MPPAEETPPKMLYQYWDAETAWRCLESGTLAFTPPIRFDDPFDTNIAIRLEITEADLREFYRREDPIVIPVSEDEFVRDHLADPQQAQRHVEGTRDDFMESFLGVACFTELKNDLRMWALYGQKHRGIMFGFDTCHSFFSGQFRKVDYSNKRPILTRLSEAPSVEQMKSKSEAWEWQREWRIPQGLRNFTRR